MPKLGFGIVKNDMEMAQDLIDAAETYAKDQSPENWSHYRNCWNLAVLMVRDTSRSAQPMPVTKELFKMVAGKENPYKIGWFTNNFGTWHNARAQHISAQNAASIHRSLSRRARTLKS